MKLFSKLAVAFLFVVTLLSCSKDEEQSTVVVQPSIQGKWEFYKSAYFSDPSLEKESDYRDWAHSCTTKKDFKDIDGEKWYDYTYKSDCNLYSFPGTWKWKVEGKEIDVTNNLGSVTTYKVLQLDATTLKLQDITERKVAKGELAYNYFILKRQ